MRQFPIFPRKQRSTLAPVRRLPTVSTRGKCIWGNHAQRTCQSRKVVFHVAMRTEYLTRVRRSRESICAAHNDLEEPKCCPMQERMTAVIVVDPVKHSTILKVHRPQAVTPSLRTSRVSNVKPSQDRVPSHPRTLPGFLPFCDARCQFCARVYVILLRPPTLGGTHPVQIRPQYFGRSRIMEYLACENVLRRAHDNMGGGYCLLESRSGIAALQITPHENQSCEYPNPHPRSPSPDPNGIPTHDAERDSAHTVTSQSRRLHPKQLLYWTLISACSGTDVLMTVIQISLDSQVLSLSSYRHLTTLPGKKTARSHPRIHPWEGNRGSMWATV